MEYLKEKYTKNYFLKEDSDGNPVNIGAEGAELFKKGAGGVREIDENILCNINFYDKSVLEFGYGRGEAIKYAINKGARKVVGVDFSQDAYTIAKEHLNRNNLTADLYCDEVLRFLESYNIHNKFDIVIMLDFIEHVPRTELTKMMSLLKKYLTDKAIIAINTPVYKVDNDVIIERLNLKNYDSSDEHEETKGMHCNRYTIKSLQDFMYKFGYHSISGHFYCNNLSIQTSIQGKKSAFKIALEEGYPIIIPENDEKYEVAFSNRDLKKMKNLTIIPKKILVFLVKNFTLPIIFSLIKKKVFKSNRSSYNPTWHTIKNGILKGYNFFVDTKDGYWQKEVIYGNYDQFFFDYLKKYDLKGKTILDIGAHIGYHTMCFAELVGNSGIVYSFEPNINNLERLKKNLSKNGILEKRVTILNVALSDKIGNTKFHSISNIDDGKSSGSFINEAHTPHAKYLYQKMGFTKAIIKTDTLNNFINSNVKTKNVFLIKIDIEGAEHLVVKGGIEILREQKPIILMEVHTFYCMLKICDLLFQIGYNIKLLKEESDGRCFIVATSI